MTEEHEAIVLARKLRYDLTAMQAKVTDLLNMLANADLPSPDLMRCYDCGVEFKSTAKLAEHAYVQHDGPEPAHWVEAEERAEAEE